MDYSIEERHRNEVLYLHSLYRQGPPVSNPNPYPINPPSQILNPNPNPYPIFNPNPLPIFNPNPPIHFLNPTPNPITHSIRFSNPNSYRSIPNFNSAIYPPRNPNPTNLIHNFRKLSVSTQFKKQKKKKKKRGKKGEGKKWPPISEKEWPCNPIPEPEPLSGWPTLNLKPTPVTREPTAEEKVRIYALQAQEKAVNAAKEMFQKNMDSDGEVEDDEEDIMDDDDDDDDVVDDDGCEEYKFFLNVFMGDSELKCYYEKNYASGEFCCLVCAGIGQKVGKKFKDCVALVQHSVAIAKTKKRQAHRALGKVICKVLGWDIEKLPSINLPKLEEGSVPQENSDSGALVNVNEGDVVQEKNDIGTDVFPDNSASELMVCEHSPMVSDTNRSVDNLNNGAPNTA